MRTITKYLSMLMVVLSILVFASQTKAQVTILTEGWETASIGSTPPAGWAVDQLGFGNWTYWVSTSSFPSGVPPYEGTRMTRFDSWDAPGGYENRLRRTVPVSTVGYSNITVDFAMLQQTVFSGDGIYIEWSTNGTTWTTAGSLWNTNGPVQQWVVRTQALPLGAAGQATLYVAFRFHSNFGYDVYLDIMHIKGVQTGNLTGTVRNCYNNALMAGVSVSCGGVGPVLTNASGVYTLNGINAGPQTITATYAGFTNYSAPVTVVGNTTTTYNFCMNPIPGVLSGVVTNCANGNPIVGAKVTFGTQFTYSVAGGLYSLNVYPGGTQNVQATKEGWENFTQNGVTVTPPATTTLNICLNEFASPPSQPFTAALNAGQTAVDLNWGLPINDMVLIYDDGIQDNFAIWATGGEANMNAMKFTPIGYPTIVKSFYVNIGNANNYPVGSNYQKPVKLSIYNEVGGLPGTEYPGTSTTITPTALGWIKADFAATVTLSSGNFFIVMTQIGNAQNSPGLAIDTTVQQMRSYSKFGATPWVPGPGNFMIRAVVNGSGGPLMMDGQSGSPITASPVPGLIYQYTPATVTGYEGSPKVYSDMGLGPDNLLGYQVWRLLQTQEGTPALWTSVGTTTTTTLTDNSWPSLPCGPYRWAVEAQYTFNRWSTATFSNVIGKCWTCNVIVNVDLSCDSTAPSGAIVTFHNTDVTDTVYTYVMDATGTHTFTNFWKGNYSLTVTKFGYTTFTWNPSPVAIMGDMTFNVMLLQIKTPPTGLNVPDSTLHATWFPPLYKVSLLSETFSSGSFATNQWVVDPGSNKWYISAGNGNPGQCAEFNYAPEVTDYSQAFTSKLLQGLYSPVQTLKYDIHLNNYGTTTLEQLAVELWDGATWHTLKNYDNSTGSDIPWTSETLDITTYANTAFKIRFRAYGQDSYNINNWNIDNISVNALTPPITPNPCVIGYNFYLNNILQGFTPDTFYDIPPANVVYGTAYHACVLAIYGSGYSTNSCFDFTSRFLCPPNSLAGVPIECNAYLTWEKPNCGGCTLATYQYETGTVTNAISINPTYQYQMGNLFPVSPTTTGVIKSFDMWFTQANTSTGQNCIVYIYNSAYTLIGQSPVFVNTAATYPSGTWVNVACPDIPYTGPFYALIDYYVPSSPIKNYLGFDGVTPQTGYPNGLAWVNASGVFSSAVSAFGGAYGSLMTWLMRANVCVSGKDKDAPITTIDPASMPMTQPVTPNLAAAANLGATGSVDAGQPSVHSPSAPAAVTLLGYRVFRNDVKIADVNGANTLEYYDYNLNPGTYQYKVDALYDVTPFKPPTYRDHSMPDGPVTVQTACGYPLPFFEPWNGGSFGYQNWTFAPSQGNWTFNTAFGNPTPCADFQWDPIVTNYDLSLVSPTIDATAWTCADIFLDVDIKLIDRNATGKELLDIDVFVNGNWVNKGELANTGSIDWTTQHINISTVMGKGFKVRFRANGESSADILHWYVDNIHIYGVCRPPTSLTGHQNEFVTNLTWVTPDCPSACTLKSYIWDNGGPYWNAISINPGYNIYQGNFFPLSASAAGVIKSFDAWFSQYSSWTAQSCVLYMFDAAQNPIGQSDPFVNGPAATWPSGTWINIPINDIPYTGAFYGMIDYTTSSVPKNGLGWDDQTIIPGQPDGLAWAWQDGVFTPADQLFGYPAPQTYSIRVNVCESSSKDNSLTVIDPSKFKHGTYVPGAATPPTGPQPAGWKNASPKPVQQTGTNLNMPKGPIGSQSLGYNVYRTADDNINGPFNKINANYVQDTVYADNHGNTTHLNSSWKYYVTVVFQDSLNPGTILCEPSSDTITINFPAVGINDLTNSSISLYPNPANDVVNIVSTDNIKTVEVLNYVGQTIYTNKNVDVKTMKLNVSGFKSGVYFVKVTTTSGIKTTKITVTH